MTNLFASGHVIDAILILMAVEVAGLLLHRRRTGHGLAPAALLITVASGASLMLALRCALTGAGAAWVGLFLTLSLLAHVADLAQRWR